MALAGLAAGCGPAKTAVGPTTGPGGAKLASLQIFYGWPSAFDGASNAQVAGAKLARYDAVVLGERLESPSHQDHGRTRQVIAALKKAHEGKGLLFGYIPLGHKRALKLAQVRARVAAWKAMGVDGIFYDEAGYDFGNTRARQNEAFAAAHAAGLSVFANAHDPADLFAVEAKAPFNTEGAKTVLRRGDHYLYESFALNLGRAEEGEERARKLAKLAPARALGVLLWGVTTVAAEGPPQLEAWRRALSLARRARLHGLGYGAYEYGATSKTIPFMATDGTFRP